MSLSGRLTPLPEKWIFKFPIMRRNIKGRPFWSRVGWLPQSLQKGTPSMDSTKYIGMDVHKESISIAVMNAYQDLAVSSEHKFGVADYPPATDQVRHATGR